MLSMQSRYPDGPLLKDPSDLDVPNLNSETVHHVANARVVLADYDAIQHDFPHLRARHLAGHDRTVRGIAASSREACVRRCIDQWLLDSAAYVSSSQVSQAVVNTRIETDGRTSIAYRPPRYGRAVVVPIPQAENERQSEALTERGLLDLKGVGVGPDRVPTNGHQSSGLEYLSIALSDYLLKKAIDGILARSLPTVSTVPVYAVLDLGFDVRDGHLGTQPAGMHVRRAHRRPVCQTDRKYEQDVVVAIEDIFRRYGITTATRGCQLHITRDDGRVTWRIGQNPSFAVSRQETVALSLALLGRSSRVTIDWPVVQLARGITWPPPSAQVVDFGHIRVESSFDSLVMGGTGSTLSERVVWPNELRFVQPNPSVALPIDRWNRKILAAQCREWSTKLRVGDLSRREFEKMCDAYLAELDTQWASQSN